MTKKRKPISELYEEENNGMAESQNNSDNEETPKDEKADTAIFGDVASDQSVATKPGETDPIAASEEILKNLSDFKEELLTGGAEIDKPRKRGRRTKAEIEREKEQEKAAIVVPPELFVFVCDNGTAHGFALIDKLITRKGKPTIQPDQISLRPEQSEKLLPVAQKCIEALKLSDDPVRAFFGSLLAIQFTNYLMIKSTLK